jgi:N-acetylneuraminic acid mutarotase
MAFDGNAQVPGMISYQGKLAVNGTNSTGTVSFKFALIAPPLATPVTLWSHNGTSAAGSEPSGSPVSLTVNHGSYSVNLGDTNTASMTVAIPASAFLNTEVYLRIWVNDGVSGFQKMSPDLRITAVGYALVARTTLEAPASSTNFSGALVGDVTGLQTATVVGSVAGVSATTVATGAIVANAATNLNTVGKIVRRDSSDGGFSAGTVSAVKFIGDGSSLTNLAKVTLAGDVTGPQGATVVGSVGGLAAATVASGSSAANAATNLNTVGKIVRRDSSDGGFSAGTVSAVKFIGDGSSLTNLAKVTLAGDVTGPQGTTMVSMVSGVSATSITNGVSAANTATNVNTVGKIVRRDTADGGFSAGTITAKFVGDGAGLTNLSITAYSPPAGTLLASQDAQDTNLIASGYQRIMTLASPSWTTGSASNALSARSGHTAVWDGLEMLIWGGSLGGVTYSAMGSLYSPDADTWSAISTIGAPAARSRHTAVWSGTEMIVWGGCGEGDNYLGTGGKFASGTQLWSPVTTSGAPEGRYGHVAVWTGSRMLVWGGLNGAGLLNSGALYDPVSNQWTAISVASPPEGRLGATAVWAGDRFIVWGGEGTGGDLDNGAQLIFSNGVPSSWVPMNSVSAPLPRRDHSAVWTGDRLIVWGGRSGESPLSDGAAYDATANVWQAMSTGSAPAPRYDHAAVWSGSEMLIVGGANASGVLSTGAAYDPVTDSWRALSNGGNPLARSQSVMVWSDTEIIIFGGWSGTQPVATLQRLIPQPAWSFYRKL